MSTDADIEGLVDALRKDGPSDRDAARMQARLAALGVVTGASLAKGAVASTLPAGKAAAVVATRWASLSLLPKVGVVAAVSATALASAVAVSHHAEAPPARERAAVAARSTKSVSRHDEAVSRAPAKDALGVSPEPALPGAVAAPATGAVARAAHVDAPSPAAKNAVTGVARTPSNEATAGASSSEAAPSARKVEAATASFDLVGGAANGAGTPASTLPAETALIDAAFAALRAGDTATASDLVAEHARRFPNGLLSREREHARERLSNATAAAPLR
jgi:hypothetical protein